MHGFPRTFGFEVFSTFTVLKMCVFGCSPKQTDRQWVGPGLQPNSDFVLMIWGSVHLPDGVPRQAQETLGMLPLGCTSLWCKCGPITYRAATVVAKLLRAGAIEGEGVRCPDSPNWKRHHKARSEACLLLSLIIHIPKIELPLPWRLGS